MASSSCWKCLSRPAISAQLLSPLPRRTGPAFSTSGIFSLPAPKERKAGPKQTVKGAKTLKIKKKAPPPKTGKPPAPGERKAMRKRIVLSNTNALEVMGMQNLSKELLLGMTNRPVNAIVAAASDLSSADDGSMVGHMVGLEGTTVDSLRASEAFKITQGWELFRRPALLIRKESVLLSKRMAEMEKRKKVLRMIIDGERGTGKSLMLLHAMATGFVQEWIVVNISEAQEISNAVNDYAPIRGTTPVIWTQNQYTANWLGQIAKANRPVLSKLGMQLQHNLPIPIPQGTTLTRLCELGARDPDVAWAVFEAFWAEITAENRPPILMCLDSLSFVMQNSLYRAPDYSFIHTHDLAIVKHFMNYFSGASPLPNGGAVLAATNRSHAPISKSLDLYIQQTVDKTAGSEVTMKDPYNKKYDAKAEEVLKGVEVLRLSGLSKKEAKGLMEYWAKSGVLRSRVDEETVSERWALAGNGVVGEIQRSALWMRI